MPQSIKGRKKSRRDAEARQKGRREQTEGGNNERRKVGEKEKQERNK